MIRRFALRFIDTYQRRVAPGLGTACPFEPSCSEYGRLAFEKHGSLKALRLTIGRLRRCNARYAGPFVDYP